jgi:hypothetical protein
MTEEDEEFNRIEREASMRKAAVMVAITKREWIGLTDEEMEDIWNKKGWYVTMFKTVEEKLKEKNT